MRTDQLMGVVITVVTVMVAVLLANWVDRKFIKA